MKIILYCINYSPEQIGIGKYTGEMAQWLSACGYEVRVITAPPYYPAWKITDGYNPWRFSFENWHGCKVWRCPLWVPSIPSALTRIFHLFSFAASSFVVMMRQVFWRPDIVFVVEPPLFCAPAALLTARLSGGIAWLHVQDFEVAAFFGLGFAKAGILRKMIVCLESWLMRQFDQVSTISNKMLIRIHGLGVLPNKTSIFPNWVDVKSICPKAKSEGLRKAWGITENQKVVLYAGNLGKKQGLDIILHVANKLRATRPDILFFLVGDGAVKKSLLKQTQQLGLQNVIFKPVQPSDIFIDLLNLADLHLVIQRRCTEDAVMPSKLAGILSVGGSAIITADADTELGQLVKDNPGIAVLVEPENPAALLSAILGHIDDFDGRRSMGSIARQYAECNLFIDNILSKFEERAQTYVERR